jgi:hypothetical protein
VPGDFSERRDVIGQTNCLLQLSAGHTHTPVFSQDRNMFKAMKKPKIVLSMTQLRNRGSGESMRPEDFAIYASYQINAGGLFVGTLKVIRKTDGRMLFPFQGAPVLGPYPSREEAREAAVHRGAQIVASDIANPED